MELALLRGLWEYEAKKILFSPHSAILFTIFISKKNP